ncbi:MAG TPA: hypothetical protein RMH99_24075 [Sandaracinaceae bacterium LLY-WYZ-13_1]|nr:hypothetical protein [Sandaracinaceae bacterium LLY-WYZ-13_1]
MRTTTIAVALLLAACEGEMARPGTDAALDARDAAPPPSDAGRDGGARDARVTSPRDGGDAPSDPDAGRPAEDCATGHDEDGDGRAGCDDGDCLDVARCVEAELTERGLDGWTRCHSLRFDEEATRTRCEDGLPGWSESTRERRCDLVPTEARVDVYCPPEPTDDDRVELRWWVSMDLASDERMLAPGLWESTSYYAELLFSHTVVEHGAGGTGGDALHSTAEGYAGAHFQAVGWRAVPRGARFVAFTAVSMETSTIRVLDGGADITSSDPETVLNAAFELPVADVPPE